MRALAFALAILMSTAGAETAHAAPATAAHQVEFDELRARLGDARELDDGPSMLATMRALLRHPALESELDPDVVIRLREQTALLARELEGSEAALPELRLAASDGTASNRLLLNMFGALLDLERIDEAAGTLTVMLISHPDLLDGVDAEPVAQLAYDDRLDDETAFVLRQALFDNGWTAPWDDGLRIAQIDALLARGDTAAAITMLEMLDEGSGIAHIRRARRYDSLVAALGPDGLPTVESAYTANDELLRQRSQTGDFGDHQIWLSALFGSGRLEAALAEADRVLALPQPTDLRNIADRVWILDRRAAILRLLGRPVEGLDQQAEASRAAVEVNVDTVSQAINRGAMHLGAGQDREAVAAVANVSARDATGYGAMQLEFVRGCAAHRIGDDAASDQSLAYAEAHWTDAPEAHLDLLICRDDQNRLAGALIRMLEMPETEARAIALFHNYIGSPVASAFERQRSRALTDAQAAPEVIAAFNKVGRRLTIPRFSLID